jgi:tetratricopeptide (TPR) repeat protein
MAGASAEVGEILRAMAAVLTVVRGRLAEVCEGLPEEEPAVDPAPDEEESVPSLRSVVGCIVTDSLDPAIRDLLRAAEQEAPAPLAAAGELDPMEVSAMSLPMSRLARELQRRIAEHQREAQEAEELYAELMVIEAEQLVPIFEDPRFRRAALVEKLLEASRDALPDGPQRAEELAALASALAVYLSDADEAAEGRVRAACRRADARRLAGDRAGAERALGEATLHSGDTGAQAELCRALGLLRWEEGRIDEAAALLERAAALWAEEEVTHEESAAGSSGRCCVSRRAGRRTSWRRYARICRS